MTYESPLLQANLLTFGIITILRKREKGKGEERGREEGKRKEAPLPEKYRQRRFISSANEETGRSSGASVILRISRSRTGSAIPVLREASTAGRAPSAALPTVRRKGFKRVPSFNRCMV